MRKLKAAAVLMALVVGTVAMGAVASAATKPAPLQVTEKVSPHKRLHAPFRYAVKGKMVAPTVCPPNSTGYCIPCPPGSTATYCIPSASTVCAGQVRITARVLSNPNLARAGVVRKIKFRLRSNCTYSRTIKIKKSRLTATNVLGPRAPGRFAKIKFTTRFLGNSVLAAKSSKSHTVRAKLVNP